MQRTTSFRASGAAGRKGALGRWALVVAGASRDALEEPDGVKVKSAAVIEDSNPYIFANLQSK
jgi:hypothetical protein